MHPKTKLIIAEFQFLIDTLSGAKLCNECLKGIALKHRELADAIDNEVKVREEHKLESDC